MDAPEPLRVLIARHGETTWNAVGRYQGRLEAPLSSRGQAQARALARALTGAGVGRIISSPLGRCVQTALPLAMQIGVPIETEPLLTEIAHGTWEGRYRSEIAENDPERFRLWREHPERARFEGGESLEDVLERWQRFVASFEPRVHTLIVTHDIVLRVAILERTGRPLSALRTIRARNGAYARFAVNAGVWVLKAEQIEPSL